jgi:hypothetical protein
MEVERMTGWICLNKPIQWNPSVAEFTSDKNKPVDNALLFHRQQDFPYQRQARLPPHITNKSSTMVLLYVVRSTSPYCNGATIHFQYFLLYFFQNFHRSERDVDNLAPDSTVRLD